MLQEMESCCRQPLKIIIAFAPQKKACKKLEDGLGSWNLVVNTSLHRSDAAMFEQFD